ncbi:MAG: HNH endonuclease [Selenomonadaceae bacterium]|nr:HNH endonuclease [Selenomonadaceae bacterium]
MVITAEERKLLVAELSKLSAETQAVVIKLLIEYDKQKFVANLELEDLPGEIWAWITGYENLYQISTKARVKSFHKGKVKILKQGFSRGGYSSVSLHKDGKAKTHLVHRLVAKAFIPNPENKPIVDHIDCNRANACVDNLRWVTQKENIQAAIQNGTHKIGSESPHAKLTEAEVKRIREDYIPYDRWYGIRAMAREYDVSLTTIADIVHYRNYKNVE